MSRFFGLPPLGGF